MDIDTDIYGECYLLQCVKNNCISANTEKSQESMKQTLQGK